MSLLDSIINTASNPVVREQHDKSQINGTRGSLDAAEMIKVGKESLAQVANRRANLATIQGKIACVYVGDTAWHELGVEVSRALTAKEAMKLASLDYCVDKRPVLVEITNDKTLLKGVYAMVRVDHDGSETAFDGVSVGERYEVIQNADCFEFLDEVLGEYGAHYETAGALGDGRKIFLTAQMPETVQPVPGDVVHSYAVLTAAHDGSEAIWCFPTDHRPVCQNTRRQAMSDRRKGLSIRHTGNVRSKIAEAKRALGIVKNEFEAFSASASQMAHVECDAMEFADVVLDSVLDITAAQAKQGAGLLAAAIQTTDAEARIEAEKKFERQIKRRKKILDEILDRYDSETNTAPGKVWSAYNAVTEYANHGLKYRGDNAKQSETRFDSLMTGRADSINQVAYEHAVSLVSN